MKISKPEISERDGKATYSVEIESRNGSSTLWYSLPNEFAGFLVDRCDAPLLALLIPAMQSGEDVYISGAVSEKLFCNLAKPYQALLKHVLPSLKYVNIYPNSLSVLDNRAAGVATGFSGGIDSYCVLADYYFSLAPFSCKVTHLLFNNVGSQGAGGEALFRKRFNRLAPIAERIGLPLLMVDSNLDDFYSIHGPNFAFQQTHTPRTVSVALMLQGGIGRYLFASAFSYPDVRVGPTNGMGYSDPVALPLISTEVLDACSVGSEYTRVQKTRRVADIRESYSMLDVCGKPTYQGGHINCSRCFKCMRTLVTLEMLGLIDRYSDCFDLDVYEQFKSKYIGKVLTSRNPFPREIRLSARERGHSFPLSSYFYAPVHYAYRKIKGKPDKSL
jgi:hypothetical protein